MALGVMALFGAGCAVVVVGAAAGAGVGAYAYIKGDVRSSEAVSLDTAIRATQAGLKDMGYVVTETTTSGSETKLTAYGPGSKKVRVTLEKLSGTVTQISIRVGTFGDEGLSAQILGKIRSHF